MEIEKKSNGAFIGLIIIIIILAIGGIYIWQVADKNSVEEKEGAPIESQTITDQDSADLNTLEQDSGTVDTNTGVDINTIN